MFLWSLPTIASAATTLALAATPRSTVYEIGAPVLVDVAVENRGDAPFSLEDAGDLFEIAAVDEAGNPVPNPARHPPRGTVVGAVRVQFIPPGGTAVVTIDAASHAWFDIPGTYRLQVRMPLDATPSADPTATAVVALESARDPAAIVASYSPFDDAPALGHTVYVPLLEPLAAASLPTQHGVFNNGLEWDGPSRIDTRAIDGLASCPCVAATDALFRLYRGFAAPELQNAIGAELALRIPGNPLQDQWFPRNTFDPALAPELVAAAHAALMRAGVDPEARRRVAWASSIIERLGSIAPSQPAPPSSADPAGRAPQGPVR
jgi:hypothetical protein